MGMLSSIKNTLFLLLFSCLFWLLILPGARTVGSVGDEAGTGTWGKYLINGDDGYCLNSTYTLHFFSRDIKFPTNFVTPYMFSLAGYILVPVFYIFGLNILAIKILGIFVSWMFLVFCFFLIEKHYGFFVAALTVVMTAISPVFVHASRFGMLHQEILINMFFLISVWLLHRYASSRNSAYLYAAALCGGLPLSIKLSAVARYGAISVAILLFFLEPLVKWIKKERKQRIIFAVIFFAAGAGLLILYNIQTGGATFKLSAETLTSYQEKGAGKVIGFVFQRFSQMLDIVTENFYIYPVSHSLKPPNIFIIFQKTAFILVLIINLFISATALNRKENKLLAAILCVFFLMIVFSAVSPASLSEIHLYMIYPFPQFLTASLIFRIRNINKKILIYCLLAAFFLLTYPFLLTRYLTVYNKRGGSMIGSPSTDIFIRYIKLIRANPIYLLCDGVTLTSLLTFTTEDNDYRIDWNYSIHDYFLNNIPINKNEFGNFLQSEFKDKQRAFLIDNFITAYIYDLRNSRLLLEEILMEQGYSIKSVFLSRNYLGEPLFELLEIRKTDNKG